MNAVQTLLKVTQARGQEDTLLFRMFSALVQVFETLV